MGTRGGGCHDSTPASGVHGAGKLEPAHTYVLYISWNASSSPCAVVIKHDGRVHLLTKPFPQSSEIFPTCVLGGIPSNMQRLQSPTRSSWIVFPTSVSLGDGFSGLQTPQHLGLEDQPDLSLGRPHRIVPVLTVCKLVSFMSTRVENDLPAAFCEARQRALPSATSRCP